MKTAENRQVEAPSPKRPHPPAFNFDLLPGEQRFATALQQLGFGRFEFIQIDGGALVLEPWPTGVRSVKFGGAPGQRYDPVAEFELKTQIAEFFDFVRSVRRGEIRCLEVRHGLPFSMELEPYNIEYFEDLPRLVTERGAAH